MRLTTCVTPAAILTHARELGEREPLVFDHDTLGRRPEAVCGIFIVHDIEEFEPATLGATDCKRCREVVEAAVFTSVDRMQRFLAGEAPAKEC